MLSKEECEIALENAAFTKEEWKEWLKENDE